MPRRARKLSDSGIYHIILRGINRQLIFEDEDDHSNFLAILQTYKGVCDYQLLAYCLMSNHVHLLVKVNQMPLGDVMRRIAGKYARHFNDEYQRSGHLFQDRFKSEPIDDDGYLLAVLRYIHLNPCKAGIVAHSADYPHSSYHDYLRKRSEALTDTEFILGMIDRERFVRFHEEASEKKCLEIENPRQLPPPDELIRKRILELFGCRAATDLQKLEKSVRNAAIRKLRKEGISIRQLARLTGISKSVIARQ